MLVWLLGLPYLSFFRNTQTLYLTQAGITLSRLFLILAYLGQLALLISLPLLTLIPLSLLCKKGNRIGGIVSTIATLFATVILVLILCDIKLYSLYHYHFNGVILQFIIQGGGSEILGLSFPEYASLTALMIGLFSLEYLLGILCWRKINLHRWQHFSLAKWIPLLALFMSYVLFFSAASATMNEDSPTSALIVNTNQLVTQAPILPFYHHIIKFFDPELSLADTFRSGEGVFKQASYTNKKLNYPLQALKFSDTKKNAPYNLVIIGLDAWRSDMQNSLVTPQINQFSKRCLIFQNHWSGGNSTQPGLFSLFYSLPGTYWDAALAAQQGPEIFKFLKQRNYHLGFFISAETFNPPYNKTLYHDIDGMPTSTPGETPAERDRHITQSALKFIQQQNAATPFFSFIFYNTSHSYCVKGDYETIFKPSLSEFNRLLLSNDDDPTPYLNRYKNAVHFVDQEIGLILKTLEQKQLLKNTVVIILGDHGEEFNDNHLNFWGHASNYTQFQTKTPLVIYWPNRPPQTFSHQTSHYDVIPTLFTELFNCTNKISDYSSGKNLFDKKDRKFLLISSYIDFAIIEPDKITRILPEGSLETVDPSNQQLNASISPEILKESFLETQRFYK